MKEINIDWIEKMEDGLVKKNPSTKMHLVDGLEATIKSLEGQIANAGKVDSVNGKTGEVVLDSHDIFLDKNSGDDTVNSTIKFLVEGMDYFAEDLHGVSNSKADKTYVDDELKKKADSTHKHNTSMIQDIHFSKSQEDLNYELKEAIYEVKDDLDEVFQSGVESNKTLVDALNSKGITASTEDSIKINAGKVGDIKQATGNAVAGDVLSGKTFSSQNGVGLVGTMSNNGTVNRTLSNQGDTFNISKGYYEGGQVKTNITNLKPENIKAGVTVGGVSGTIHALPTSKAPNSKIETIRPHSGYETRTVRLPKNADNYSLILAAGGYEGANPIFNVKTGKLLGGLNMFFDGIKLTSNKEAVEIKTFGPEETFYIEIFLWD